MRKGAERKFIEDYDYPLPEERIAKFPLLERSSCKLLCYYPREERFLDTDFHRISELLPSGALLIRNNSRVIRARIFMERATGAKIELFCLSPLCPTSFEQALASTGETTWHCLIGNAKKWKEGTLEKPFVMPDGNSITLFAERSDSAPFEVTFRFDNSQYTFGQILETVGALPIPPYLRRESEVRDLTDYQTVYAIKEGSVAAPTAGLHFTESLLVEVKEKGITVADVTLHVGAGTFLPVKTAEIAEHVMHAEVCSVSRETIEVMLRQHGNIAVVGTTSVRTLESLYYLALNHIDEISSYNDTGHLPHVEQWEPYQDESDSQPNGYDLLEKLLAVMQQRLLTSVSFTTSLFIVPGYQFHFCSLLITNFHQPKSTLLLMIAAFVGEGWREVYRHALDGGYRFLSYGDATLLFPSL